LGEVIDHVAQALLTLRASGAQLAVRRANYAPFTEGMFSQ
jgi:hypothetical protein